MTPENIDNFKRFDMKRPPKLCPWYLKPIAWAISFPWVWKHKTEVTKINMEGIKPPYVLLGNHNAFYDMPVAATATFPYFGNFIVALDGFIGREWLLRRIGCIAKRKFTQDLTLIKHLKTVVKKKGIVAFYPEARYSLCGTTAVLPESLGKLCKMLDIPVVTLITHGHHITHPFWNTRHDRKVKHTTATMKLLYTKEDLERMTAEEINDGLVKDFQYDDFKWQLENKIKVDCKDRAVGLEKILYQCPHCKKEFQMKSEGIRLSCQACGKVWEMSEYGQLAALEGETEFSHIPDWYEWERENVKKEVAAGTYSSGELPIRVKSLPNVKRFIDIGKGIMTHDMNGFKVTVTDKDGVTRTMEKSVPSLYSCHIEFEYLFKHGDCVDLNTLKDTWYTFPYDKPFSITKMALATEELYYDFRRKIGKPCRTGLA